MRAMTIQRLLWLMVAFVLLSILAIEGFCIASYRQTLFAGSQSLMNAKIDELYGGIHDIWHEITLVSSTFSRSDAVREFVLSPEPDDRQMRSLRAMVNILQLTGQRLTSVIVTDFGERTYFAARPEDHEVLAYVRRAMAQGLVIKSPIHLQMGHGEEMVPFCVNRTENGPDGKPLYTVLIYSLAPFRNAFTEASEMAASILLLDGTDQVITANRPHAQTEAEALIHTEQSDVRGRQQAVQVRRLSRLSWRILALQDPSVDEARMQPMMTVIMWTDLCILAGLLVLVLVLRAQIDKPIQHMLRFMGQVADNQLNRRLRLTTHNELSVIQDGLNNMLDRIEAMARENALGRERQFMLQLSRQHAEIAALASQINPHFLFNTLDCMRGIALSGSRAQLETIINALAAIFRYAIRERPEVTLAEEMHIIGRYMAIVEVRHGGRIQMESRIAPDTEQCLIPKMILQPLVENAVQHGLESVAREGRLAIHTRREGEMLLIFVEDDGRGLSQEEVTRLTEQIESGDALDEHMNSTHIGLRNIHKRLRLRYGAACGLTLEQRDSGGMRVVVRIIREN